MSTAQTIISLPSSGEILEPVPEVSYGGYVFAGFGVVGRQGVSVDVPFDILLMILEAESIRRSKFGAGLMFLVADSHALRTSRHDPDVIRRAAEVRREIIFRACEKLLVPDYIVVLASEVGSDDFYQELSKEAEERADGDGKYFILESTDIEFFRLVGGIKVKVGWSLASSSKDVGRFDERAFDHVYQKIFPGGAGLEFAYTRPGRTLDPAKPNAAPYLSFNNEARVIIQRGEDVASKIAACRHEGASRAVLAHLAEIVEKWERLTNRQFGPSETVEKVSALIASLTA